MLRELLFCEHKALLEQKNSGVHERLAASVDEKLKKYKFFCLVQRREHSHARASVLLFSTRVVRN